MRGRPDDVLWLATTRLDAFAKWSYALYAIKRSINDSPLFSALSVWSGRRLGTQCAETTLNMMSSVTRSCSWQELHRDHQVIPVSTKAVVQIIAYFTICEAKFFDHVAFIRPDRVVWLAFSCISTLSSSVGCHEIKKTGEQVAYYYYY